MPLFKRILAILSDLRLAIALLLIALASALEPFFLSRKPPICIWNASMQTRWLGLINGDLMLRLQLDHVYASNWFLTLLALLGLALMPLQLARQWPALQAALRWIDYSRPRQLSKLALAETRTCSDSEQALNALAGELKASGWEVRQQSDRLAAVAAWWAKSDLCWCTPAWCFS